jgi:hypothetical protein
MPLLRTDRFVLSRKPYAVALGEDGFAHPTPYGRFTTPRGTTHTFAQVDVLYVRRTRGVLGVHLGTLSALFDVVGDRPITWERFVSDYDDARFGASPVARWTGVSLWTPEPVSEERREHLLSVLRPAYALMAPQVEDKKPVQAPSGWDGWWLLREKWQMAGCAVS